MGTNFNFGRKKVIKLPHKEGIKLIVKQKNKSIEQSVKLNLVSKNESSGSNYYVVVCFGSLRVLLLIPVSRPAQCPAIGSWMAGLGIALSPF